MNYLNMREFGILKEKKNINSIGLLNNLIYNAKKGDKETLLNILEKLINKGINLNYRDENGFSVLHYAVDEGNFKICEILIKTNLIDINLKSLNEGKSPLHISCQNGYFDISKLLLLNNSEINISDNERNTPLHYSIEGNFFEITKLLLNNIKDFSILKKKNIYGQNLISLSSKCSNDKIKDLIDFYSDKNLNNESNLNKTEMNLLNLALSPNSNKRNRLIRSKGVLYSNSNNLCSSHKKLVSYMNKYSSGDYNKEIEHNNNNNNNNAKKKIYHLHSISSMNEQISTFNPLQNKNKNLKENKNNNNDVNNKNNNSDLFNISQSSYKANSNFKTSTTANTLGTINTNISNNSLNDNNNKIKKEEKKDLKKNLNIQIGTDKKKNYHKIIQVSNTNTNSKSKSNKKHIRNESKKSNKKDESKRLFIELSDSDINEKKNPKIESVTIDLNEIKKEIEENKMKNKIKSRNSKLNDNTKDNKK